VRPASSRHIAGIVLALCVALPGAATAAEPPEPSFGQHYVRAFGGASLGGVVGLGFGLMSTQGARREEALLGMGLGLTGGMVVGAAYAANTITPRHEREGSLLLDLVATVGTTIGGFALASAIGKGGDSAPVALLVGAGSVPLGAVVAQRMVAGAPEVVAFRAGERSEAVGLAAVWSLR
jgi:hypothetical protein